MAHDTGVQVFPVYGMYHCLNQCLPILNVSKGEQEEGLKGNSEGIPAAPVVHDEGCK